jgi:hypothetical protein
LVAAVPSEPNWTSPFTKPIKKITGLINSVRYLGLLAIVKPFGQKYKLLKWVSCSVPADHDIEPQLLAAIHILLYDKNSLDRIISCRNVVSGLRIETNVVYVQYLCKTWFYKKGASSTINFRMSQFLQNLSS